MKLIDQPITKIALKKIAQARFGNLVKAVVDIKKQIIVIDADLHADQEALLLEKGSNQADLWGINLYPDLTDKDFVEFDSMINLRPSQGNLSRSVTDPHLQSQIRSLVSKLITP